MPPNNWEDEFGKAPDEMDENEYRVAVLSTLYRLKKDVGNQQSKSEEKFAILQEKIEIHSQGISRHEKFIWGGCILVPTLFGLFAWLAEKLLR